MTIALKAGAFFGQTVSARIADAVLSEVRHDLGKTVPAHTHEYAYFSLLIEGSYRETSGGDTIAYDPFTVVFHAPLMEHTDTIGPAGGRFFMVELLPRWTEMIAAAGGLPEHFVELAGGDPAWLMSRLYQEFLTRDATTELSIESLLYELCAFAGHMPATPAHEPPWMADVDRNLQRNFTDAISVRALAEAARVHPSHLCRAFHRFRGRSIGDYVVGLRMQLACRRVVETEWPLADVAAEAGFTDQSHMSRIFKRLVGQAPGEYRRRIRKKFED
ncbi:MAG TPA: AraC family transcriptional regulator [Candidatus Rubrimentiphilum sp.]|nr:AraC family transcriptional regulator [Candidatus Rubrimentiphilum sp.]